jgi:hypothetical protein
MVGHRVGTLRQSPLVKDWEGTELEGKLTQAQTEAMMALAAAPWVV